jgi:hypothetical protein
MSVAVNDGTWNDEDEVHEEDLTDSDNAIMAPPKPQNKQSKTTTKQTTTPAEEVGIRY